MDPSASITRIRGRLNLAGDVIGRIGKDHGGDSMTRHTDVEGHLPKTNHESEA
jgi:hypothetical protein